MNEPQIIPGCAVLPPIRSLRLPSVANDSHRYNQDHVYQNKAKKKPARRKTAGRFAEFNSFVDFTLAKLKRNELAVWFVLFRDTKPDGTARTSQADLARRVGANIRTVQRAIRRLTDKGLLQVVYRGSLGCGASTYRVQPLLPNE